VANLSAKMKSYEILQKISQSLYIGLKSEEDLLDRLKTSSTELTATISEDFKELFKHTIYLDKPRFVVNDETYRQGATGCILTGTTGNNEQLRIRFECLIDHNRIWIKIKEGNEIKEFKSIIRRIQNAYNSENLAEFKEIK
jgi:hypothetical protein